MKKSNHVGKMIVFVFFLLIATFYGCKKDITDPITTQKEVSFNLNSVSENGGFKSTNVICTDLQASYVKYKLGSDDFKSIPVFYVNGFPWTSSIKLDAGTYTLNEFLVYNDNSTPTNLNDDILVSATPHDGSEYASFCKNGTLNKTFTVNTDLKTEVRIDVVCFVPEVFTNFGFAYFQMNELKVHEMYFFGDIGLKSKADYQASLYSQQTNWNLVNPLPGLNYIDVPAIMKIEVWKNNVLQNTYTNGNVDSANFSKKLSVKYGDYQNQADNFEIKLFVLVKQGNAFIYNYFKSYTFTDISNIPKGTDGVTDFSLGIMYDPNNIPDLIIAPWMNLPLTATYKITGSYVGLPNPLPTLGAYVDAKLTNITPNGVYDLNNGTYASNCTDHQTIININTDYNMDVYSSLYQDKLPIFAQSTKWNKINWIYNQLKNGKYYSPSYTNGIAYTWNDIQGAIWLYDATVWNGQAYAGMPALTALSTQMKADADANGANFLPFPGGWAAVIFVPAGTAHNATSATVQTMMIRIDP
jgi:hypothetical protein